MEKKKTTSVDRQEETAIGKALRAIVGEEQLHCEEPLSRHTTFRIGGPAEYFVLPRNEEELCAVLKLCEERKLAWYLIGNGSNLLVSDAGVRGVVISLEKGWRELRIQGNAMRVGAGLLLSKVANAAAAASLGGLEFAAGIPGTVGGAVRMNAGAYGGEIKDVLREAKVLTKEGRTKVLTKEELQFSYRQSCVSQKGYLVLEVVFELHPAAESEIRQRMQELSVSRREKQPLEYPSAGSTFKRPEGYFAGKLIEEAGLRGFAVGDAQVSEKHCGFVINRGNATAEQVMSLCEHIQKKVQEQFGVKLEMEVQKMG
ncbi:MAG: UDP-N-acetylmuramate dehydrogenase [bacterium]|nr:UDP-N-acetylmuramate dehydrogenase [bacterium]